MKKNRSKLFIMLQKKIQKRAKSFLEEEQAKEICDIANDLIKDTYARMKPTNKECKECLLILNNLKSDV